MTITPGVYEDVDFDEYRKWPADFSASELKALAKCDNMAEFKWERDHPKKWDSKALSNGRAVDSLLSHMKDPVGMNFEKWFIHLPANAEKPRGNKKFENYTQGERLYAAIEKEATRTGKEVITHEAFIAATEQVNSLKDGWFKDTFDTLITKGIFQPSLLWREEAHDLTGKGRPDVWLPEEGLLVDFKTTSDDHIDQKAWGEWIFRWSTQIQIDCYRRAIEALGYPFRGFVFIAMRSKPPYVCNVLETPEECLVIGRKQTEKLLEKLSKAIHNDEWPSYSEIKKFIVPAWARNI